MHFNQIDITYCVVLLVLNLQSLHSVNHACIQKKENRQPSFKGGGGDILIRGRK